MRFMNPSAGLLCTLVLIFVTGCSSKESWHVHTTPVTGTIQINGETHSGVFVILVSKSDIDSRGSRPWGRTDSEGNFTLSTYKNGDGCPFGEYDVTVRWPVDPNELGTADRLNNRFTSPGNALMTITIDESTTSLPPIEVNNIDVLDTGKLPALNNDGPKTMSIKRK